ncbi:outer membrane lipoprotein carrier protein LolA [Candidatus Lariskella endosymbiont of Epinotia ramella]|uniref:LolA family protein n=1 Tax=Candidatus Lariskella endosymbiont of Epinotia ramella TaxID=3066224 RepID=UPI0030CB00D1
MNNLTIRNIVAIKISLLILCFLLSHAASCIAANKPLDILGNVQAYINSISTMQANFEERDLQKGIIRNGMLYISRPGKIKWEYESPDKRLVIASGDKVIYYDYALEELSTLPVKSNILKVLSKTPIDLHSDCQVISVYEDTNGNYVDVALTDKTQQEIENILILKFAVKPKISLSHIGLMGPNGEALTEISITNLQYGMKFGKDMFSFKDPKFFELER